MTHTTSERSGLDLAQLLADGSPVLDLAAVFRAAGHELYLVGGPVRDAYLRRPHQDLDFSTDAAPEETLAIVNPIAESVWKQGMRFGTVGARVAGIDVEITTFRSERYAEGSRHPEVTYDADVESDLSRRDFTVNAMAIRLPERTPVDPFNGLEDLRVGVLRTPIDPVSSFTDDPLRMMRAFRFAAELEFKIAPDTLEAISKLTDQLDTVSSERVRDELSRLMVGERPGTALKLAYGTGLTERFLPELSALQLEQDPVHRHKDVFHHTLAVVERTEPVLELRLAALLHDIGKPRTREITNDGVTFHHHEIVGAKMARTRLRALKYPNDVVDTVTQLIKLHHRFHTYSLGWTDSAVRRYVRDVGALRPTLHKLLRADCTTRNAARAREMAARVDDLEERITELAAREEIESIRPEIDGHAIMSFLGVTPGPIVGEAREFLLEIRLEEGPIGEEESFERLAAWARERGIEPAR